MQPQPDAPLPAPAPPGVPRVIVPSPHVGGSPRDAYLALANKREVLGDQMSRLLNRRQRVSEQLHSANVTPAERSALEQHLQELNTRIIDMEKQLHSADAEVAAAAGVPGAAASVRHLPNSGPPEEMLVTGTVFAGIAVVIVAIAYARRLWRGASTMVAQLPATFEARFTRFEQSLDAMAIEIERVSEGQRFLTKVLAEQKPRGVEAGVPQPVEHRGTLGEPVRRG